MRILLVNANGADRSAGGAERYTADLARGLMQRGHEVRLLAAAPPRDDRLGVETVVLHREDWRDSIGRRIANRFADLHPTPSNRLQEQLRATTPDLVHTGTLPGITTAIWEAADRAGVPVVHTLHDYYLICARTSLTRRDGSPCSPNPVLCGFRSRQLLRNARFVSHLIGVSNFVLRSHRDLLPEAAVHVVRHPVALDVPKPDRPPSRAPAALGYIGRLENEKGVGLLLDAAEALREHGFAVRIAGDGSLRSRVEDAERAGRVSYHGVVHDEQKTAFLGACDIGVVPSLWLEPGGPPYSLLEWLAAGRPALATRRGGLAEVSELFPAVEPAGDTANELVAAALRLRGETRFDAAVTSLAGLDPTSAREHWLDEHERVYSAATE